MKINSTQEPLSKAISSHSSSMEFMSGMINVFVIALILILSVVVEFNLSLQLSTPLITMAYSPFVVYSDSETTASSDVLIL